MKRLLFPLLLFPVAAPAQTGGCSSCGTFTDGYTTLVLSADSSFLLTIFDSYSRGALSQKEQGRWEDSGGKVVLNPDKAKRRPEISLTEKVVPGQDGLVIRIDYQEAVYDGETLKEQRPADFGVLGLYLNKESHYHNIVHTRIMRPPCLLAPPLRRQYVTDSTNTVRLPRQEVRKIGLSTNHLGKTVELTPANPAANYFEIRIVQPLDASYQIRSKSVVVRRDRAFYYEIDGEVDTDSPHFLEKAGQ